MIKAVALVGVILGSGAMGRLKLSAVKERQELLCVLRRDGERLCGLLTEQGMTLPTALRKISVGSRLSEEYNAIAETKRKMGYEEQDSLHDFRTMSGFAPLKDRELRCFAEFLQKLGESISAHEVSRAGACFREEMERAVQTLESGELKRAKVLQKVWLLAGMCAAVILI